MNNELIKTNYNGEEIIFKIENGISYVRIDEVAKFCGWTQIKNEKEYIKWERVNEKLVVLNSPTLGKRRFHSRKHNISINRNGRYDKE